MPHFVRIQAIIRRSSGDPADDQTNTWYFDGDDDGNSWDDIANNGISALDTFYTAIYAVDQSQFTGVVDFKAYDLEDPEPRIPRIESAGTIRTAAKSSLPHECSVVLSFQAERVSGLTQARRRGRVYLPTPTTAEVSYGGGNVVWDQTDCIDPIIAAAEALATGMPSGNNWAVFSPTTFNLEGALDPAMNDVLNGWVDAEPDTQRRRGRSAANRTTFPV